MSAIRSSVALLAVVAVHAVSISPGSAAEGPAVFDSVPVPILHTPYDARWRRALDGRLNGAHPLVAQARSLEPLARLRWVNRTVNGLVRYRDDPPRGARRDVWSTAVETLSARAGDCEDFAIAKFQILSASGMPPGDLFLVLGTDHVRRAPHAVLVAREAGELWVLDNNRAEPVRAAAFRGFSPILSLASGQRWVHGYPMGRVPLRLAGRHASAPFQAASGGSTLEAVVAAQTGREPAR